MKLCAFRCLISGPQILNFEVSKSNSWKITSFTKTTSEGAVSHNVLYYQPLPKCRYQVRFYANNYFDVHCL